MSRGQTWRVFALEGPRAVDSLIACQTLGRAEQNLRVVHLAGFLSRRQSGRELQAGEPLVRKRPVAAVVFPAPGGRSASDWYPLDRGRYRQSRHRPA